MTDGKGVTVLFLGSGFSKAVGGGPVQAEFLKEVLEGREYWIDNCGIEINRDELSNWMLQVNDVEVCMSHLHNLAYTDLAAGNAQGRHSSKKAIINLRGVVTEYLKQKMPLWSNEPTWCKFHDEYLKRENLVILTTNYDLVVERLIERTDSHSRYIYPHIPLDSIEPALHGSDSIPIYKLHGSINWMERRRFVGDELIGMPPLGVRIVNRFSIPAIESIPSLVDFEAAPSRGMSGRLL